jgi:amidophosphoribosyltransferase
VLASETCALDLLEAEYLREVRPGEMVVIDGGRMSSMQAVKAEQITPCIFELIYFARPDSIVFGHTVYTCRKNMGRMLAEEAPVEADFCMPFPDSGVYAAVGYAQASGLPFENAMIRNHYVGRTFIQPSQDMRDFGVRVKLNPVKDMIKGKRIVIIEDSIVRGTTIRTRIKKLREMGARELHLRVSCPPICHPCYYGIDFSSKGELIAANHTVADIAKYIGLDSLHFLSVDGLRRAVGQDQDYCLACFQGEYPVLPGEHYGKARFD